MYCEQIEEVSGTTKPRGVVYFGFDGAMNIIKGTAADMNCTL